MTRLALILAAAALLRAQSPLVKHGSEVFRNTCAVPYCHGPEGTAGRAPALAGHAWKANSLFYLILGGKPGTGMPGFSRQLTSDDIEAVTQYVISLSGPSRMGADSLKPAAEPLPAEVQKGRSLFFDAVRMGGCGRCHELDDRGSAVGPDLRAVGAKQFTDLRAASHTRVLTAQPVNEDPFPALLVEQTPDRVRVYDLTSPLPVLRTFEAGQIRITPGGTWSHAAATADYSRAELDAISAYLRWVVRTPL